MWVTWPARYILPAAGIVAVSAEILICVVQRKPVSLRFTALSEHEYDGVRYDANSLFWQVISKRFRREPFDPNLSPYVVDLETADVPMPVFVSALRLGSNHLRVRLSGREYVQPLAVDSSADLDDVVLDLRWLPQRHDYRSFVFVSLVPLTDAVTAYRLGESAVGLQTSITGQPASFTIVSTGEPKKRLTPPPRRST